VTFRAVAQVYPESPLAKQAEAASRNAERQEERTGGPIVRSIAFENISPANSREILERFEQREVGLAAEQAYHQEDVDQARIAIAELLAEKGVHNADIRADVRNLPNNRVKITFRAM
jgi:outer membrane protein assembly factor BamA